MVTNRLEIPLRRVSGLRNVSSCWGSSLFVLGHAGGQLGLVLGASSITFLEVIDLAIFIIIYWLQAKYHAWKGKWRPIGKAGVSKRHEDSLGKSGKRYRNRHTSKKREDAGLYECTWYVSLEAQGDSSSGGNLSALLNIYSKSKAATCPVKRSASDANEVSIPCREHGKDELFVHCSAAGAISKNESAIIKAQLTWPRTEIQKDRLVFISKLQLGTGSMVCNCIFRVGNCHSVSFSFIIAKDAVCVNTLNYVVGNFYLNVGFD